MATETKTRPWLTPVLVVIAIMLAWTFFSARGAGSQATDIEALLMVPDLDVTFVPGGPERFGERFTAAREDAEDPEAPIDELRWATLIVANDGLAEAEDVTATLTLADGVEPMFLADLASFGGLDVEAGEEGIELDLADIDTDETALVFLGFQPDALPEGVADAWAGAYEQTVDTIEFAGDVDSELYYGGAL